MGKEGYFTFKEFRETFFPNVTNEELEGEKTDKEIQEDLNKIVKKAVGTPPKREIDSKKQPRV